MSKGFIVHESHFQEVLPLWKNELWPERQSPIEPTSAIDRNGLISVDLLSQPSFFWKIQNGPQIVGVVSAQITSKDELRSRGLWVHPDFRGNNLGTLLMEAVSKKSESLEKKILWTMARAPSMPFYLKLEFKNQAEIAGYEYGPHYLLEKRVAN